MEKKSRKFLYRTNVSWIEEKKGYLCSEGKPTIEVSTPPEFKGHEGMWTPEELFVASVNICIKTTFLHYAEKNGFKFLSYQSHAEGTLEKVDNTLGDVQGFVFWYQFPDYNKYYMEGYVKETIVPSARTVYAYRADTGELMDYTTSNSGTGYFYLETSYSGAHYLVCLDDVAGTNYNDLVYGQIYPTVISGSFAFLARLTDNALDVGIPLFRQ